jgi:hypothetical protein
VYLYINKEKLKTKEMKTLCVVYLPENALYNEGKGLTAYGSQQNSFESSRLEASEEIQEKLGLKPLKNVVSVEVAKKIATLLPSVGRRINFIVNGWTLDSTAYGGINEATVEYAASLPEGPHFMEKTKRAEVSLDYKGIFGKAMDECVSFYRACTQSYYA